MANRHGLITGATGTGKTRTLAEMAESLLPRRPGLMADVKGDLSGRCAGVASEKMLKRLESIGSKTYPAGQHRRILGVFGEIRSSGARHHIRHGTALLARLLNLNETQSGVLTLVFKSPTTTGFCCLI